MTQSSGRGGDAGVRRGRAEDAAGGGCSTSMEKLTGGDGAPAPRATATGLPSRGRAGRPPMAPRGLERHRGVEEFPSEREPAKEEAKTIAVRPHGAPRQNGESASYDKGQRSAATGLGGSGRGERRQDAVDYTRGRGHERDAVEWPRESKSPSQEPEALAVRARGAPQERPRPEADASAAGKRFPATAHLGRHHGGLVSPCDDEKLEGNGVVSDDDLPQHRHAGATDGREKSKVAAGHDKSSSRTSTADAVHSDTSAMPAPNRGRIQSPGSAEAGEGGSCDKLCVDPVPDSAAAAAGGHLDGLDGVKSTTVTEVAGQQNADQSEMLQNIDSQLFKTKAVLDVDFVETWLKEKHRDSTLSYFQEYASPAERAWYNKWVSCLTEYTDSTSDLSHQTAFRNCYCGGMSAQDLVDFLNITQDQKCKCSMNDLLNGNFKAMHCLVEFLYRSCLVPNPNLEFCALTMFLAATSAKSNLHVLGSKIPLIGIVVIKSFTGSPKVQSQALKLLSNLCGLHANTKKVLDMGGFSSAIHVLQLSDLGAETAAQLILVLLQSECSYPSIFEDHLCYHVVKSVGIGRLKDRRTIHDILLLASRVDLALSCFFDVLKILKPGCRTRNFLFGMLLKIASAEAEDD